MRYPVGKHVPAITIRTAGELTAYRDGLDDGQHARLYNPPSIDDPDARKAYTAGFERARQMPHMKKGIGK